MAAEDGPWFRALTQCWDWPLNSRSCCIHPVRIAQHVTGLPGLLVRPERSRSYQLVQHLLLSSQAADQDAAHGGKRDADDDYSRRLGPWFRHFEDENANACVDQQTELSDRETHAGTHPCDQPKQGKIANAEEDAGRDLRRRNPRAQLCRPTRCGNQYRSGGEYAKGHGEVSQLRRYLRPLCRHEVTAPQYAGSAGEQIPEPVAVSCSRDRRSVRGSSFFATHLDCRCIAALSILRTDDEQDACQYQHHPGAEHDKVGCGEAAELSEEQRAPDEGDDDVQRRPRAAGSSKADGLRRPEGEIVSADPHHAADEWQPEWTPPEGEVPATDDQGTEGKGGISESDVAHP